MLDWVHIPATERRRDFDIVDFAGVECCEGGDLLVSYNGLYVGYYAHILSPTPTKMCSTT